MTYLKNLVKSLALTTWIAFVASHAYAQVPLEGSFLFEKSITARANGTMIEISKPADLVRKAIETRFQAFSQAKQKDMGKGMFAYEATMYPEISASTLTYYFRVEEGTKKSPKTRVFLFLSPGYDNFLSSEKYWQEMQNASRFLSLIPAEAEKLALGSEIAATKSAVEAEEAELKKITSEKEKLAKEIAKMEEALLQLKKQMADLDQQTEKVNAEILQKQKTAEELKQTLRSVEGGR